jgi:hypothetical protein
LQVGLLNDHQRLHAEHLQGNDTGSLR